MNSAQPFISVISALSYCSIYTLACLLFGAGLLRFVKICPSKALNLSGAGYLGGAFFLGQGIFGALWQVIATLGFFSLSVVVPILVLAAFLGIFQFSSIMRLTFQRFKFVIKDTWNLGLIWTGLAIVLVLLIASFACLTLHPPNCDALAYYLAQEKLMALTHQLTPLQGYELLCHFGMNAEMHGSVMYLMGGDIVGEYAANMLVWVTAVASGVMLWAISSQVGLTRRGQWSVMIMLFTSTAFTLVMWAGKTDLFGAGLGLAAIYWVLQIGKVADWIALLLAGLIVGFAINSKMSFIVVMIPMLAALAALLLSKNFISNEVNERPVWISLFKYLIKGAFIAGGAVFVAFLPLFFKNTVIFNEPLAPFVYLHMAGNSALNQVWYSPENTRWIVLTYPLALTFGQYPMQFGNISPLWLAFLPSLFLFPKWLGLFHNKPLSYLTASSLFGVMFWILLQPSTFAPRYFLSPLLTLFPLGGYIIDQVWRKIGFFVLRVVMILAIYIMLLMTFFGLNSALTLATYYCFGGVISPPNFQQTYHNEVWKAFSVVNEKAKEGDRVFLIMYSRLPLRSDLLQTLFTVEEMSKMGSHPWEDVYISGSLWIIADLITHGTFKAFLPLIQLKGVPEYLTIVTHPIGEHLIVYQIVPKEGAPKPLKASVKQEDGTWKVQDVVH